MSTNQSIVPLSFITLQLCPPLLARLQTNTVGYFHQLPSQLPRQFPIASPKFLLQLVPQMIIRAVLRHINGL